MKPDTPGRARFLELQHDAALRHAEQLRQLAGDGLTQAEVARRLGVSKQRMSQLAVKYGIRFRRCHRLPVGESLKTGP